ncbi:HAD hydrolase-like protein [Solirubrobacter phytolaccae]|uniref:HAD hydrolase-like protein n=1 Tax=Solirubrobacter phytolaccae TaxID=1404360 RepID=A0A9X3NAR7_9ACTN|nr:HAD family hydrolase [Solirubrobacter phytolaccae]MDA0183013.1 HAD hydrolase-like protein [Solirubrobacter phytolaccae]
MERIVIFDLDDTLVHSNAVREAFACVARERGIDPVLMTRTLDTLPGRPAQDIFECLGLDAAAAQAATDRFLARLDELNGALPTVAYADAHDTLNALAARGCTLALSTGSPPERARQILDQEGWDAFKVVLGSTDACRKGHAHYEQVAAAQAADPRWTRRAITVGDSPADMRLGAEHGVPIRIGIDRDGDPRPLLAAGATHVVSGLADILRIIPT